MNDTVPWLTLLTLTPAVGAVVAWFAGRRGGRPVAWLTSLLALAQVLHLALVYDRPLGLTQFTERHAWIPSIGAEYYVGIDGLGMAMLVLTALLVPLAWTVVPAEARESAGYHALVLLLQTALFGAFSSLNFLHWFLFWELSLVPAYFLVRLWGGAGRAAAANQFFLYTFAGSVAMLLGMQVVYLATGTFDLVALGMTGKAGTLAETVGAKVHWLGMDGAALARLAFVGVLVGLAVKVPLMPFHTWLPATYAEAPSGVTLLLTGAMSKLGLYGFLRILLPLFPVQAREYLPLLLGLAVLTIVASAFAAWAQTDLKRMLAYSSVNHLGLCLLGIFAALVPGQTGAGEAAVAAALGGVVVQMFNHGLAAGTLFACVALLERRSGGLRGLGDFGGLRAVTPVFAGLMGTAIFASLGLPGLNGFVGEYLIFRGAFPAAPLASAVATIGLLVTAIFLLTTIQRVFSGPVNPRWSAMPDLTAAERWQLAPAVALLLLFGVLPQLLAAYVNPTVLAWIVRLPH